MSKELELFNLCKEWAEQDYNGKPFSVEETTDSLHEVGSYRVYHKDGYCFKSSCEAVCDEDEVEGWENVDKDGKHYGFCCPFDGFKDCTVDEAIKLLKA